MALDLGTGLVMSALILGGFAFLAFYIHSQKNTPEKKQNPILNALLLTIIIAVILTYVTVVGVVSPEFWRKHWYFIIIIFALVFVMTMSRIMLKRNEFHPYELYKTAVKSGEWFLDQKLLRDNSQINPFQQYTTTKEGNYKMGCFNLMFEDGSEWIAKVDVKENILRYFALSKHIRKEDLARRPAAPYDNNQQKVIEEDGFEQTEQQDEQSSEY